MTAEGLKFAFPKIYDEVFTEGEKQGIELVFEWAANNIAHCGDCPAQDKCRIGKPCKETLREQFEEDVKDGIST